MPMAGTFKRVDLAIYQAESDGRSRVRLAP